MRCPIAIAARRSWPASTATTRLFRYNAQQAKACFEAGDWHGIRRLARERIAFYDQRVREAVQTLQPAVQRQATCATRSGATVKRRYVALLAEHKQPELAETFFNSVSYQDPAPHATSTTTSSSCARRSPPTTSRLDAAVVSLLLPADGRLGAGACAGSSSTSGWPAPFQDIDRDLGCVAGRRPHGTCAPDFAPASDCQIHVLRSLFFRNKAAYLIGRLVNDGEVEPFAIPILHDAQRPAVPRHGAVRQPNGSRRCSTSRAPTSWSTWKCRRPTCASCRR